MFGQFYNSFDQVDPEAPSRIRTETYCLEGSHASR